MRGYSEKNQQWLIEQCAERGMAPPTDVKSFKAFAAEGRRVKKGEKALKIWCPIKRRGEKTKNLESLKDEEVSVWFRPGNVFDVQQTESVEEWKARRIAEEHTEVA